jgi:hypothetical protein
MEARIYIPDGQTYTTDFFIDSFQYTEVYYNNLKPADNSCRITVPFSESLADDLKLKIDKDIKAQIKNNDGTNFFTGYVRKTVSFEKGQRHQPIALEIVSPSYLLKKELSEGIMLKNNSVSNIVTELLSKVGFSNNSSLVISYIVPFFLAEAGENLYDIVTQLLFEFGYTFSFDADGNVVIYDLFNQPAGTTITQHFNGYTIIGSLTQDVKENTYNNITVKWSTAQYYTNLLLYENTEGRNAAHPDGCQLRVNPNAYLFGNEWNILEYDSALGTVVWVDDISVNDSGNTDIKADYPLVVTRPVENLGKSARLQIRNSSTSAAGFVDRLRIRGNAYIEETGQIAREPGDGKAKTYEAKYNHDEALIDALAKKIAEYYKYAQFTCKILSYENYPLGSFVIIVEDLMGTVKGRIIKKQYQLNEPISYTIESIDEYDPVENVEIIKKASSKMNNLLAVPPDLTSPTIPKITAIQALNDGTIQVTFNPSSDHESGMNYYNVYRSESTTPSGDVDHPTCILSLQHTGAEITFVDHTTQNHIYYTYQITAMDKANNESVKSDSGTAQSSISDKPTSPYLIKAEAISDGISINIFVYGDTTVFENTITNTTFFRLQVSMDTGVSWIDIGKIQGNYYLWKWPESFSITSNNVNKLKFRAFSWNMFNVENNIPIGMMNHKVRFNAASLGPPYIPEDSLFTELVANTSGSVTLTRGWYKLILKGAGGGGGGGGGKGGTGKRTSVWVFGVAVNGADGSSGGSGKAGAQGGDSFIILQSSKTTITAYGGKPGIGGEGGHGGAGKGEMVGLPGQPGSNGSPGDPGGYASTVFFNNEFTQGTLKVGTGGDGGSGGNKGSNG